LLFREKAMLRVILNEPGALQAVDVREPEAAPGEALLRIRRIGVCGTDLHAYRGRQPFFSYPRVLGHELGAEIIQVGENSRRLKAGDKVAVEPYLSCGECRACRMGRTNCCTSLQVMGVHCDGGMQELYAVPARLLHKSEKLDLEQLALIETLGIGYHAVERGAVQPGEWVVVVGADRVGDGAVRVDGRRQSDRRGCQRGSAGVLREAGHPAYRRGRRGCFGGS
jgi:threonine dehydrogenase-like Zn-dependent dehydrogenase